MPAFTRQYSRELEDAVATAYEDRGIRPMRHLLELAAKGELAPGLEPAEIPNATARGWVNTLRKRRSGEIKRKQIEAPDAAQALKRRLLAMVDGELAFEERKRAGNRDPERIRQLARALREAAAIPEQGQRGLKPGQKIPGTQQRESGATEGGLAASILAAAQGKGHRSENPPPQDHAHGDSAGLGAAPATTHTESNGDGARGSSVEARQAALRTVAA